MLLSGLGLRYRYIQFSAIGTNWTTPSFGSAAEARGHPRAARDRGDCILCGSRESIADIPSDNVPAMYDKNAKG